eukprot:s1448_g19.t1
MTPVKRQDEAKLASPEDFQTLDQLHQRACAACPSSAVWLARCSFYREKCTEPDAAERTRQVYEEALKILGLHPGFGPEIWADYRDFEEGLLAAASEQAQQVQRVRTETSETWRGGWWADFRVCEKRTLFMRQMALPLPGGERLQEAHATFEGALDPALHPSDAKISELSKEAAELWQQRKTLEEKLREAILGCLWSRPSMVMVSVAPDSETQATPASPAEIAAELLQLEEASGDKDRIFTAHLRCTQFSPKEGPQGLGQLLGS